MQGWHGQVKKEACCMWWNCLYYGLNCLYFWIARLLGDWEKAKSDLATACKIDWDDQADEWLKAAAPNV